MLECFRNRRIVVTGASGYIASHLVNALSSVKCQIYRVTGNKNKLQKHADPKALFHDIEMDIQTGDFEKHMPSCDFVFHLAAQTTPLKSGDNLYTDFNANVKPLLNMLEAFNKRGIKPFILFAGAVTEAGITTKVPVNENLPDAPVSIYDLHKLAAENYLKYFTRIGQAAGCILRLPNIYGPSQENNLPDRGILNKMIFSAMKGNTLAIYGQGGQLRDFLYIDDLVAAMLAAAEKATAVNGRHFVIGTGKGVSLADAIKLVSERVRIKTGLKTLVINAEPPEPLPEIEKRNFVADPKAFSLLTGWKAQYKLKDGIDKTIEYYSKRKAAG